MDNRIYEELKNLIFNEDYYNLQFPTNTQHGLDHFLDIGFREGYNPHPLFCTKYVLEQLDAPASDQDIFKLYSDNAYPGTYISPIQIFNVNYYLALYEDVYLAKVDPFIHFCQFGFFENRQCSTMFRASAKSKVSQSMRRAFIRETSSLDLFIDNYNGISFFDIPYLQSIYGAFVVERYFQGEILIPFNIERLFGSITYCSADEIDLFAECFKLAQLQQPIQ